MSEIEYIEEANDWLKSAILNRNKGYLEAAHRCELRAEFCLQIADSAYGFLPGYCAGIYYDE